VFPSSKKSHENNKTQNISQNEVESDSAKDQVLSKKKKIDRGFLGCVECSTLSSLLLVTLRREVGNSKDY
jgi:hypothetical protein